MMKKIILPLLILMAVFVHGQSQKKIYYFDKNEVPREHPLDFQHLKLEVSFEPKEGKVIGKVTHDFKVLAWEADTVFLDGPGIKITSALLDGEKLNYHVRSEGFVFDFGKKLKSGESHQMQIEYTATPTKGIYFIGWNDFSNRSRKQIWTQGQGIDNRHWIPMYDMPNDKVTTEVIVSVESNFKVLSNGDLLSQKKDKSGKTTWHYKLKKPHPTYLIMLGIGEYEIKQTKSPSGVPMNFYYYPDQAHKVEPTYRYSEDMMRFMEEETGVAYPWGAYSQIPVQDFLYGAMENTSATVYGDFYFVDDRTYLDRNYVRVNAHELAHQWFGDYISARTSTHTWLQESFATHYDLKYQGIAFGENAYHWARHNAALSALAASGIDFKPLAHSEAGTARHYPKGSYVLQMLREVAGNENFKKAINYYLNKHALQNVESNDLLVAFHESTGLSLDWFWEEWIYRGGEPFYKVRFETSHMEEKHYGRFIIEQAQEQNEFVGLFKMPIDLEIHFEDGDKVSERVWVENQNHIFDFEIPSSKNITYALFDAGSKVLKKVEFEKPFDMLLHQAIKSENVLDRYDAVKALEGTPVEIKRNVFHKIFKTGDFHAVRSEIFRQLMFDPESRELWKLALTDKDHELKKTALMNTVSIYPDLIPQYEALLNDESYDVVQLALEKLCTHFEGTEKVHEYLEATRMINGNNELNVRMSWLQIDYYEHNSKESLDKLIDYVSPAYEFRTRIEAAKILKSLNYLDSKLVSYLFDGHFSYNPRLRTPMKEILDYYIGNLSNKKMIKDAAMRGNWDEWEKRRLNMLKL